MKKSTLLEKIIKKAKELCVEEGKESIDSDYFVLATLAILDEDINDGTVNLVEKDRLNKIVMTHVTDLKKAYSSLYDKVKNAENVFSFSSIIYNKLEYEVEKSAEKEGCEEIASDALFSAILSQPTDNLKSTILCKKTDSVETIDVSSSLEAATDSSKAEEDKNRAIDEILSILEEKKKEIEKEKKVDSSNVEKSSMSLGMLVSKVKNAQKKLTEVVHGQDHAINTLISGYYQAEIVSMMQSASKRPKATFLFTGPPGVGKTFLAEQTANVLGLPFMRFDMSEYSDKEANIEFCGSDKVYKNAKEGNVTGFVSKNPKCILLFDEIEKAHINVIHLFLQILDAGRIRDNYTDLEVSFADAILIFTTNVGRKLYEDTDIENLSTISRKQVLNSLRLDVNPETGAPLFPTAICSRFAAGNVIMFNRLGAYNLLQIAEKEFNKYISAFKNKTKIDVAVDKKVLYALLFAEGGNVDARTIRGRTANFFCQETFELFRLITSEEREFNIDNLSEIKFSINLPEDEKVSNLFEDIKNPNILIFTSKQMANECKDVLNGVSAFYTDDINEAKEIIFNNNISLILCDLKCGLKNTNQDILNLEDAKSVGADFFNYAVENIHIPLYVLEENIDDVTQEEKTSFIRNGARDVVSLYNKNEKKYSFSELIIEKCIFANQQNKLLELARANKILLYKTAQQVSNDGKTAVITLFDFKMDIAPDVEDGKSILSGVSKPNARFSDVIGAEDAKGELSYFVEYLKDPISYMRRGVRAPKGILLYGPSGTGKTLLAKAMAGESDVTFIASEGNDFLKKFVGEGAEKVHEIFRIARKYAPAILFIDEIDAIGKDRNIGSGSETNTGDVLTAFLTEMDGFKSQPDKPVFVLAATNYEIEQGKGKTLDAALLRRFDRKILVDLPNKPERERFIRQKVAKNKNVSLSDEQIDNIAIRSTNMSLADLESIFELALRDSIKAKNYIVDDKCFENAFESYNSGEIKKWDISQLERTARHEAGHALLCWLSGETPSYLTIVARASHGGYMQHNTDETKGIYTKEDLLSRIRTSLAGRAAEVVYYGVEDGISTGPSGDLQSASSIAEQMICVYGMDEKIGLSTTDLSHIDSSYYSKIKERINEILLIELNNAKKAISDNKLALDKLVEVLMEKNQLKGKEIDKILSTYVSK